MSRAGLTYRGNFRAGPRWLGDFATRDHLMPFPAKLDPTAFRNYGGVQIRVSANTAADQTALPIDAIGSGDVAVVIADNAVAIPKGVTLDFGTGKKFARLTEDALIGDVSLTVAALPAALVAGDRAVYNKSGIRLVTGGSFIGRTFAERDAATPFGAVDTAGPDDEVYLTLYDAEAVGSEPVDVEVVRHNTVIKENYLPGWADYTADMKTLLRSKYRCIVGVD